MRIKAYAKINLSLDVLSKRKDGYHLIDSVMQTVSLFDLMRIEKNTSGEVVVNCKQISNQDNICYKAAKLFLNKINSCDGVKIDIEKAIPVAAGMGGGSSNAAATLNALNELYNKPLNFEELSVLALSLGADVPFFLKGGTQRAESTGERLSLVENNVFYALVIVKNDLKPSTKEMYEKLDAQNRKSSHYTQALVTALKEDNFEKMCQSIGNDFNELWDNAEIKNALKECGAKAVCLSGSGPTVFGIFKDSNTAISAAAILRNKYTNVYTALPTKEAFYVE